MRGFTPQILRFDSLPSTNLEAVSRAVAGAPEGLCIVAAEQTEGRGRRERKWVSPKGAGLYFSILLRPTLDQSDWPLLTLMSAVAVQDTLAATCGLRADIKWPNDVLYDERKLCGILAETVETSLGGAVVVGIGINLKHNSFPGELDRVVTSVEAATKQVPDLEVLLEALVGSISKYYQVLQSSGGPDEIVHEWSTRSSYASGKQIRVANGDDILEGTTRGLERDGALRIETDSGEVKVIRAGDVSSMRASGRTRAVE